MDKLIEIILNYVEIDDISPKHNLKKDLGLASFDTVCMIKDIEGCFGIKLEVQDFIKSRTVGGLWETIEAKLL